MTLRILFAGDGTLERVALPVFVRRILEKAARHSISVFPEFHAWSSLHLHFPGEVGRNAGLPKKVEFLARNAADFGAVAVVVVVDGDDWPAERRSALRRGRDLAHERGAHVPIALGVAVPHGEAWLVGDRSAVLDALGDSAEEPAPWPDGDPKQQIEALLARGAADGPSRLEMHGRVAETADLRRIETASSNGFAEFRSDVRQNLGVLVGADPPTARP